MIESNSYECIKMKNGRFTTVLVCLFFRFFFGSIHPSIDGMQRGWVCQSTDYIHKSAVCLIKVYKNRVRFFSFFSLKRQIGLFNLITEESNSRTLTESFLTPIFYMLFF